MRPFAFWWSPELAQAERLQGQIEELATLFGGPVFPPHITGFGGSFFDKQALIDTVEHIMADVAAFRIQVRGWRESSNLFQAFALDLDNPPTMQAVANQLMATDPKSTYQLRPHLSLIYATLAQATRDQLRRETPLFPGPLNITRWSLVHPTAGWADFSSWTTIAEGDLKTTNI